MDRSVEEVGPVFHRIAAALGAQEDPAVIAEREELEGELVEITEPLPQLARSLCYCPGQSPETPGQIQETR